MRTLTLGLLLTAGTLTVLGVGYAVHFDRKRRKDPTFRKQLRLDKKRAAMAKKASEAHEKEATAAAVTNLLKAAEADQLPVSIEEREAYFMQQVGQGETLAAQSASSPAALQQAALCFYRALKVYPSPVELVMIYQKTLRKELFDLVMALFSAEMKKKQDEYYESFPPRDMNVVVEEFEAGVSAEGSKVIRKGLTAARNLKAGEVIYTEKPVASCLQPALEGIFCSYCMKQLPDDAFEIIDAAEVELTANSGVLVGESEVAETEAEHSGERDVAENVNPIPIAPLASAKSGSKKPKLSCSGCGILSFCSEECQKTGMSQHHEALCAAAPKKDSDNASENMAHDTSNASIAKLIQYCREKNITYPLMVARFLVQMARDEFRNTTSAVEGAVTGKETYTTWDHIERLRYLEVQTDEDLAVELALLVGTLGSKFDGMEEFINLERYAILKGKMLYNSLAVNTGEDAPLKLESSKQVLRGSAPEAPTGAGLYKVTSYIAHSCNPNVRVTFANGTNELFLVANRDVPAGEELRVSFIPNADSRTTADRRAALAETWRFKCSCPKCLTREA